VDQPLAHAHPGSPPLKAAPHDQLRLLDLQAMDSRLDQLAHRRATLPELAALAALDARLAELHDLIVTVQTEASDTEVEQTKAEADVEQVRARTARDRHRMDAGDVSSARELENLQHEIESLARRQSDLEDVELEVMERLEVAQTRAAELVAERDSVLASQAEVAARRDAALAEIDAEVATTTELRRILAGQIDQALVELYERLRAGANARGVGAATLRSGRCEGCRLEMTPSDLGRFRAADPDEVLRCEECRRILVRTEESGL